MRRVFALLMVILLVAAGSPAKADDTAALKALETRLQLLETKVQLLESQLKERAAAIVDVNAVYERARHSVIGLFVVKNTPRGEAISTGSGVIWWRSGDRKEAQALTNYHVVQDMVELSVILTDGRVVSGTLVQRDADLDLAVIGFSLSDLPPPIELGDSDNLRIGQPVIALGNPLGHHNSVTLGIFSGRNHQIDNNGYEFLQTDAAVNPGNSGGPLLDKDGRLVGLVTLKEVQTNVEGMAYAISLRSLLLSNGVGYRSDSKRAYLGAIVAESPVLSLGAKFPTRTGVTLSTIDPLGPLGYTDFRAGDELLRIGEVDLYDLTDVRKAVDTILPGTKVTVVARRNGQEFQRSITLGGVARWDPKLVRVLKVNLANWEGVF